MGKKLVDSDEDDDSEDDYRGAGGSEDEQDVPAGMLTGEWVVAASSNDTGMQALGAYARCMGQKGKEGGGVGGRGREARCLGEPVGTVWSDSGRSDLMALVSSGPAPWETLPSACKLKFTSFSHFERLIERMTESVPTCPVQT